MPKTRRKTKEKPIRNIENSECGICLNTYLSSELTDVRDKDTIAEGISINDVFQKYIRIDFPVFSNSNTLGFSTKSCRECVSHVKSFHDFIVKCVRSHDKLTENLEVIIKEIPVEVAVESIKEPQHDILHQNSDEFETEVFEDNPQILDQEDDTEIQKEDTITIEKLPTENFTSNQPCIKCGKRFSKKENYEKHITVNCVSSINPSCRFCKKTFRDLENLEEHLNQYHPPDRPYKCMKCNKGFQSISNLNTHIQSHNPDTTYSCSQCSKTFKSKVYLSKHVKFVHSISGNILKYFFFTLSFHLF